jgi:ubiquitin C
MTQKFNILPPSTHDVGHSVEACLGFELSADTVNCGGLITVVFGNSMVGPVTAVGFFFFYTMALGLYLMMVTTVRTAVLKPHAKYLAILLKVLLVITLITALIHGVRH